MSGVLGVPVPDQKDRADESHEQRLNACKMPDRGTARTVANGEELLYDQTYGANFHKGLPHSPEGFVEPAAYREYVDALLNQDHARFEGIAAGDNFPKVTHPRRTTGGKDSHRKMTSPFAGHVYDLQGADAGALALVPAPVLASDELAAEMAELYVMALLRDESFTDIAAKPVANANPNLITTLTTALQGMAWFKPDNAFRAVGDRRRPLTDAAGLFRGSTDGSRKGPWLSQYLLVGNQGPPPLVRNQRPPVANAAPLTPHLQALPQVADGLVYYGTQVIDQRTVTAEPKNDWMQTWAAWLDAQNGVDFNGLDLIRPERQFITTPRDIVTYVHFDALYQAYQVACLLMLAGGSPFKFDRGFPESRSNTRNSFATFGGPHVLTLVTEVATRALKAVWRQKWLHHRRLRPEVVAAYLTLWAHKPSDIPDPALRDALETLHDKIPKEIRDAIAAKNKKDTKTSPTLSAQAVKPNRPAVGLPDIKAEKNYLLPMAFPEGSPMHPAYGAGHATVAGACVTALKAFFEMYCPDGKTELPWPLMAPTAGTYGFDDVYVGNGAALQVAPVVPGAPCLTIQGELDKLAGNIAVARNMAGVHYYTDYFASLRMGERITVSLLQDQAAQYGERMSMSFTSFDGDRIRVSGQNGRGEVSIIDRAGFVVSPPDWFQRYP